MTRSCLALVILSGCLSSPDNTAAALTVFPKTTLYSGVESGTGAIQYKLAISTSGAAGITWTSSDPTIATVTGTDALGTITSVATGAAMIDIKAGTASAQVPVTIATYKASDRMAAAKVWTATCSAAGCHDASGPDVTPSGIGKHSDMQLQATVLSGQNPEGGPVSIGAANHSFAMAPMPGMIAYMRSLPPGVPHDDE